ncbi:MAG: GyrI-like domain-containing protein [Ferruginibacter sp.]
MNTVALEEIYLIGLSLKIKTTNENGQSHKDCERLWHEFEKEKYAAMIPGKLSDEILGVYHGYEGDSTKPFSYFIGCKVQAGTVVPAGLNSLTIPAGPYHKITVKGKMPDCMVNAWKEIWVTDIARTYQVDFEVYDERSKDWNNAEVEVYLSVKDVVK